jgi:ribosomal protein S18 acetylase RimI-like enzyme
MTTTVRTAVAADAPVIVEFNQRLASETESKTLDPAVVSAGVAAGLADPDKAAYYVAEEDGVVVGLLMVTREWSDWRNGWLWWIQSVYVRAAARRRGVFRSLYDHVYRMASADPAVIGLRLYMEENNHTAARTYRGVGMEPAGYVVFQRFPL